MAVGPRGKDFQLKHMDKFVDNLNKEIRDLKGRTHKGLIKAAIKVWRKADESTPRDLSNLRHSFFITSYKAGGNFAPGSTKTGSFKGEESSEMSSHHKNVVRTTEAAARSEGSDSEPIVVLGYSASYAVYVHENLDANFSYPGAKARWFYAALQETRGEVLRTIKQEAHFSNG